MQRFDDPPYYISAYGLAVKRGYKGTLDEWLASLQGKKGDRVELRSQGGVLQWRWIPDAAAAEEGTGEWQNLMDLSGNGGGVPGEDGATFTPHVDEHGNLSWTNNKGLENPPDVNIKGPPGEDGKDGAPGVPGDDGEDGADGYTPVKGVDYFTQADKEELTGAVLGELPLTVAGDGYTEISGLRQVTGAAIHEGADKTTVTLTLEGGITEGYEILWDENGYPAKITREDGRVCALSWTADEPEEEAFDGVLFDGGSAVTWLDGSGAEVSGASLTGSASVVSAYGDYFYTAEPVDLTDFDKLKVNFTAANDNNTFAVSKTVSTLAADFAASGIVTAAGVAELDISALTGEHYVLVLSGTPMTGSTSTFTADKVWLE